MHSGMFSSLKGYKSCEMKADVRIVDLRQYLRKFTRLLEDMLDSNCKPGMCTLKFHMVNHVVDYVE